MIGLKSRIQIPVPNSSPSYMVSEFRDYAGTQRAKGTTTLFDWNSEAEQKIIDYERREGAMNISQDDFS